MRAGSWRARTFSSLAVPSYRRFFAGHVLSLLGFWMRIVAQGWLVYDITGSKAFTADDLAALYSELGGKPVRARALEDGEFIATLVGDAKGDSHLRYGAELVASFGRSIREGYMDSCTDAVEKLTGRAPRALAEVLAPLRRG